MASFAFNGTGHDNSDSDIFEEGQPWYQSVTLWVIVGAIVVGFLVFAFRAWTETVVQRKTDAFLAVYAQATDNATRLKVLESHPDVPETAADLLVVGASFLDAGDRENAAKAFALAADRFPHSELAGGVWLAQGQLLATQGKSAEAEAKLRKVLSSPDRTTQGYRPLALLTLARLHQEGGKIGEARQDLQELTAKYPDSSFAPEARAALGRLPAGS